MFTFQRVSHLGGTVCQIKVTFRNKSAMLDFAIFAITFVVFLLGLVFYLYPGSSSQTTIPGFNPSDPKEGNLPDIYECGGVHPFLQELHENHGAIASFWIGRKLIVSLADPELFEQHLQVFDKPDELFLVYKSFGENSLLFASGAEGRKKRQLVDKFYSYEARETFLPSLVEYAQELCSKWSSIPSEQHIPLYQYMTALTIKLSACLIFGKAVEKEQTILELVKNFKTFWTELEAKQSRFTSDVDSPQEKQFSQALEKVQEAISKIIKSSQSASSGSLIELFQKEDAPHQQIVDDVLVNLVKSYSLASALTWALYFLSTHKDVQEKISEEIESFSNLDTLSIEDFEKMKYVKQVVNETLRLSVVEPWTARYQDLDVEIGGHIIPKQTPVIHALGVVMKSKDMWSQAEVFDPDRFADENIKSIPNCGFKPFGFAGKRQCPGSDLTNLAMTVLITTVCKKLRLFLVDDQVVRPSYLLFTRPEDEVWVYVSKRS